MLPIARLLMIGLFVGLATPAAAGAGPSESDKATARHLVALGDELFARVDYLGALDAYRGADELMHVPTTSILVAKTLVVIGRLLEADALLETFERDVAHAEPTPFTAARARARALHRDLSTRIPRLTLVVEPPPRDGTVVALDGRPVATGTMIWVDPGSHLVEVAAADGGRTSRQIVLTEGSVDRVAMTHPAPAESMPSVGAPLAWTGLAILGAGTIVGGVFGGLSMKRVSDAERRCPSKRNCDASTREMIDESTSFAHVSTTSFVVAGLGAGLALTGLGVVVAADDDRDLTAHVSLGAFAISGAF